MRRGIEKETTGAQWQPEGDAQVMRESGGGQRALLAGGVWQYKRGGRRLQDTKQVGMVQPRATDRAAMAQHGRHCDQGINQTDAQSTPRAAAPQGGQGSVVGAGRLVVRRRKDKSSRVHSAAGPNPNELGGIEASIIEETKETGRQAPGVEPRGGGAKNERRLRVRFGRMGSESV